MPETKRLEEIRESTAFDNLSGQQINYNIGGGAINRAPTCFYRIIYHPYCNLIAFSLFLFHE